MMEVIMIRVKVSETDSGFPGAGMLVGRSHKHATGERAAPRLVSQSMFYCFLGNIFENSI